MTNSNSEQKEPLVALVTGASRGIGAKIALRLAHDGMHVVLNYASRRDCAEGVLAQIEAEGGTGCLAGFDVMDADAVKTGLQKIARDHHISVLVNNAGVAEDMPFAAMHEQAWTRVTRTTLDGFYHVTRPLVMPMVRARFGRIVNISSVSGLIGNRGQVNYSAAKAGLIGATKALAQEVAKRKVTVNAVAPGLIDTDMIADAPIEDMLSHIPMRRLGQAEEVAHLVSFLCSEKAGYITGQVIGINGGLA